MRTAGRTGRGLRRRTAALLHLSQFFVGLGLQPFHLHLELLEKTGLQLRVQTTALCPFGVVLVAKVVQLNATHPAHSRGQRRRR